MNGEDTTHYVGDDCPGGHEDVAVLLNLCRCGRALPCRHCDK